MDYTGNIKCLNYLGEFSEKKLEREYFQHEMAGSLRFIKPIILLLGIFNTLFLIPDYFLIGSMASFIPVFAGRLIFILFVIGLSIRIKYMNNYRHLAYWITVFELSSILLFLFVLFQYEAPDYLIQAFGVMVILIAVFMIPNRFVYKLVVSLTISVGFIVLALIYIRNIKTSDFYAGVIYIFLVMILAGIMAYRNNYLKRIQYMDHKELIRLSSTDYLTGACNRAKLDEEMKRWILHARRYAMPLSFIILDFDNFKKVNDTYGHLAGDSVIKETAQIIRDSIRETDIFARWGGEEFALLLPDTDKMQAAELAERLRKKIESHIYGDIEKMTCCFGVVQLEKADSMDSLFERVDNKLYEAKKTVGKNKVAY